MEKYIIESMYLFSSYFIFCLWGLPILAISEIHTIKAYRFITMPLLGFGFSSIVLFYLFLIDVPVKQATIIVSSLVLILDAVIIIKKIVVLSKRDMLHMLNASLWALVVGAFWLLPTGIFGDSINTLGRGNGDLGNYGGVIALFKNIGYSSAATGGGVVVPTVESQTRGACFTVAYFSTLYGISIWRTLDIGFIMSNIFISLSGYMLGKIIGKSQKAAVLSCVLMLFNCGYIYLNQESFFGQLSSIPLLILVTSVMLSKNDSDDKILGIEKKAILIGLLSSMMMSTYMEQVPFMGVIYVDVFVVTLLKERENLKLLCREYIIALIVIAVTYGRGLVSLYNTIRYVGGVAAGWPIPYGALPQALGLYNPYLQSLGALDYVEWPSRFIITGSIILFLGIVTYVLTKHEGIEKWIIFSLVVLFSLVYLVFVWEFRSYQTFKGLVNMEFLFIVLFASACSDGISRFKERKWYIKTLGIVCTGLISLVILSGFDFFQRLFVQHSTVQSNKLTYNFGNFGHEDSDNDALQAFLADYNDTKVMVRMADVVDGCEAVVAAVEAGIPVNYISDKDAYLDWNIDMAVNTGKFFNVESNIIRDPIITVGNIVFQNDTFLIKEVRTDVPICDDRGRMYVGIIQIDKDGYIITGRNSDKSYYSLKYLSNKSGKHPMFMSIQAPETEHLEIRMNNSVVDTVMLNQGNNDFIFENIEFKEGENILEIRNTDCNMLDNTWITKLCVGDIAEENPSPVKMNMITMPNGFMGTFWENIVKLAGDTETKLPTPNMLPADGLIMFEKENFNGAEYTVDGMSTPEPQGTWTSGTKTLFLFYKGKSNSEKLCVSIDLEYVLNGSQNVFIRINGEDVFSDTVKDTHKQISFETDLSKDGIYLMEINVPNAVSPKELGLSEDVRTLGLMIKQIRIR